MTRVSDDHVAATLAKVLDDARDHTVDIGMFLTKSVLLANGAALLACFTALANGRVCTPEAFQPLLWIFAAGLAVSFGALTASYYGGLWLVSNLAGQSRHAAAIINSNNSEEEPSAARILLGGAARSFKRWALMGPILLQSLHALGAIIFLVGILAPLLWPGIMDALCPAETSLGAGGAPRD